MNNTILLIAIAVILILVVWSILQQTLNKDALYIKKTLRLAAGKNSKVGSYLTKWRMWKVWMKVRRIHKLNDEIISTLQKDKKRFPLGDKFFSLYLDSSLQVLQTYLTLVSQPVRNAEVQKGIADSEFSLNEIIIGLETELTHILNTEIQAVETEKEVLGKYSR
ncbi:MAG: 5-bromo-4-chloroindolyl phosphate hydrolysis family protein [Turicibacter sp.]|nr:5-bromo-4-chloroindolyl phosphate hydrolysis family protein [Turicibacter sp.]